MNSAITLSEQGGMRYLHFGTEWVQGAMQIKAPTVLALNYARQMMAWLLFRESAQSILHLGLGTGSLSKFCLTHLPDAQITAVEISEEVIQVAHSLFYVPRQDSRLRIHCADAKTYVEAALQEKSARQDVIQVDLYDAAARAPVHGGLAFYSACAQLLKKEGWFSINLFGRHNSFQPNLDALYEAFPTLVIFPSLPEGNIIVLATLQKDFVLNEAQCLARAQVLKADYGLNLLPFINGIQVLSH